MNTMNIVCKSKTLLCHWVSYIFFRHFRLNCAGAFSTTRRRFNDVLLLGKKSCSSYMNGMKKNLWSILLKQFSGQVVYTWSKLWQYLSWEAAEKYHYLPIAYARKPSTHSIDLNIKLFGKMSMTVNWYIFVHE